LIKSDPEMKTDTAPRAVGIAAAMLSGLLLAAHFFRAGWYPLSVFGLLFPLLLLIKKTWATRIVQFFLILAGAEWLHTLIAIAAQRHATGQPWIRMAIILGVVVLFNVWSAMAVRKKREILQQRRK
jgi:hypothetical protein